MVGLTLYKVAQGTPLKLCNPEPEVGFKALDISRLNSPSPHHELPFLGKSNSWGSGDFHWGPIRCEVQSECKQALLEVVCSVPRRLKVTIERKHTE